MQGNVIHWWNRVAAKLVEGSYWPLWLIEMAEPYWDMVADEEELDVNDRDRAICGNL